MIQLCAFADEAGDALETQIAALKRNGISLIEVRKVGDKNVADLTDGEARATARVLEQNGIRVWSVGSPLGKVDLADAVAHMEKVRRVCEIAVLLHTENVRVFSFFKAENEPAAVKAYLAQMVAIAREYGLTLCHENEKGIFGDTVARVKELASAGVEGLAFVYDPANYIQCGQDTREAMAAMFDRTRYFHIKDVIAETGQLVPAGEGDGHIDELLARIRDTGRDAVLTLEPHLKVFAGYADIDDTALQTKYVYETNEESFDAAANAMRGLLIGAGYHAAVNEKGEHIWQAR
ncbi:MAG: sugar phosphate isomerase/epimerase [Clostridia bacterium]|nr:sugar phosphate isomerase/epimerase [Clostridia bacterium]